MYRHPALRDGVFLIDLSFSLGEVFVAIDEDLDTLICSRIAPSLVGIDSVFASPFWDPLIGHALTNAWMMTNDRGYPDAIQLRFRASPNEGQYTIVQLCAEASQITISELTVFRHLSIRDSASIPNAEFG